MWRKYQYALEQQVVNFHNLNWVSPLWFRILRIRKKGVEMVHACTWISKVIAQVLSYTTSDLLQWIYTHATPLVPDIPGQSFTSRVKLFWSELDGLQELSRELVHPISVSLSSVLTLSVSLEVNAPPVGRVLLLTTSTWYRGSILIMLLLNVVMPQNVASSSHQWITSFCSEQ